jgi:hypothetical protein
VGELAELMKELDPTIPPDNFETIRAEAGDVLWYLVLLISSQKEVFKNFTFRPISSSKTYFEIRKVFHWIDKLCKYSNQHDLDDMGVWKPREDCINITVYLYEILDFLLLCTDLSLVELIWGNQSKLEKRLENESRPDLRSINQLFSFRKLNLLNILAWDSGKNLILFFKPKKQQGMNFFILWLHYNMTYFNAIVK